MGLKKKLILLGLVVMNIVEQPTPEVTIEQGTLRGRVSSDGLMFEYLGIPYATANETNRFQPPYPPPQWKGVYSAFDEHHRCPQRFGKFVIGQEDCLKINVYTPSKSSNMLPVMVFIHGGGYFENSASPSIYGADYFVRHGVILVTFNYRLGALGFLCLRLKEAPGNIGLRDQIAALKWVKTNIRAFGGDPDNVTLFGESAGASSISFLKLTPLAKGLFQRTIIQSGSSLGAWSIETNPVASASRIARHLGYPTTDPKELLDFYKKTSINELITTEVPKLNISIVTSRLMFIPCIEAKFPGIDNIIGEHPYYTLSSGRYNDVPTISGINDREGLFLVAKETSQSLAEKENSTYLPSNLEFRSDEERLAIFKNVKSLYFGDKKINKETVLNLADLYGDVFFLMPTIFEADLISKTANNTIFNYIFKYGGYRNIVKFISGFITTGGASHADELFYMFRSKLLPGIFRIDQVVLDRFTTMWTNFAKFGDPIPTTSSLFQTKWIPSKPGHLNFLNIGEDISMGSVPFPERTNFWNETYTKYRKKY